ncbi:MAG: FtsQ-type POTRA domain-containing protein [Eggerthellaceae bacterium]|nr:FtsQ-type POTRA domain-containing protein [Eggerthellaceae bacterium]
MPNRGDRQFRATRGTGTKRTDAGRSRSTSQPRTGSTSTSHSTSRDSSSARSQVRTQSHTHTQQRSGSKSRSNAASHASSRSTSYASARSTGRTPTRTSARAAQRTTERTEQRKTERSAQRTTERTAQRSTKRRSKRATSKSSEQRIQGKTSDSMQFESRRIGDIRRSERRERAKENSRRYLVRIFIGIGIIVALIGGWAALYNSPAFTIQNVEVEGVEHLTADEMSQLANVPTDNTLLRVDTETIRNRLKQTAWVEDAAVTRKFPDTIKITVTEREIEAIVEIPNRSGSSTKKWAIAKDHIWLMPIPEPGSEAAKTTSEKIYEDAEAALHITDVPYGTVAEIGQPCQDSNVNNALDIISGMTTDLANHVETVSAAGPAETTLLLDSGVEIAFGKAENIRDKERVILQILEENPDSVAYINVRLVETPTWRSI